jgi:cytoskeleton protein RodZ
VEVRNSAGEPLLYEVVRAGQKRAFSDGAPFSVRIGNVRGVRATVTGTNLDLNSFARGNVARFEVAQRDGAWQALSRNSEPASTTRDGG